MNAPSLNPSKKRTEVQKMFEKAEWGQFLEEIPAIDAIQKNSNICLFGDGQWLVRKNQLGVFCRKYNSQGIPGLDDGPEPFFKFDLPKIPLEILKQQVSFYRDVMDQYNGAEAYSIVLYDLEEKKYFLEIPKQRISGASVSYAQDELRKKYPSTRYLEVISAHSHNSMGAFFSSVDDADEKGDLIYMVMGKLDLDVPTFKIRANVAGRQASLLSIEDIFDTTCEEWESLSPSWKNLHNKSWMKMLNVAADYRSPHHQNWTFVGGKTLARSNHKKWPTSGRSPFIAGREVSSQQGFFSQQSFDDFFYYGNSYADQYDEDTIKLRGIAKNLADYAISLTPATAISMILDEIIEAGYGADLFCAVETSSAASLLWASSESDAALGFAKQEEIRLEEVAQKAAEALTTWAKSFQL